MRASPEREYDELGRDDLGAHEGGSCGCKAARCETRRRSWCSINGQGPSSRQGGRTGAGAQSGNSDLTPTIKELQTAGCESLRAIAAGLEGRTEG